MNIRYRLHHPDGTSEIHDLSGRVEDTLAKLMDAGSAGLTTLEYPAPRTSDYVFKLRRRGFVIETLTEPHGGEFPGHHGRYILRSKVERQDLEYSSSSPNATNLLV